MLTRRRLATMLATALLPVAAHAASPVRLGLVQYGTAQWVADVIRRHKLDAAHGIDLATTILANNDAGRIALMAGSADIVVSDWMFAAAQRAAGTALCFAPFSSALGGIMVPAGASIASLADLKGKRLGVAGGPVDKSWLLVQAAAKAQGVDLAHDATVAFAAPPLLNAKLGQGELDAALTFWPFAARLEAQGFREAIPVTACAQALGLPVPLSLVGYVFREDWARANRAAIDGFLAAAAQAEDLLAHDDAEWAALRPLMDALGDALFAALRRRFVGGIAHPSAAEQQRVAAQVFAVLLQQGGKAATAGLSALPDGVFWDRTDGGG
jgi:NitT/TauT family transport system substrate-binding protein